MNFILNRIDFSKNIIIKGNLIENIDFNLLKNKYNNGDITYYKSYICLCIIQKVFLTLESESASSA